MCVNCFYIWGEIIWKHFSLFFLKILALEQNGKLIIDFCEKTCYSVNRFQGMQF